ncbi:MAG TPA: flagellar hook assembly protein FlgD [Beijerinckiaceae bacterium]|nr:flagellar hook assembly protein FlgD [Beijerinckiaceae bacterium]
MTDVTAATAGPTTGPSGAKRTGIADNFDAFLLLLTTQLRNQSPLEPLDTNQFTQQLVQFASVEQQLKSNETLKALLAGAKASTMSTAASFIGKEVTAEGATTRLGPDGAAWVLDAARPASQATIVIRDREGSIVATSTKSLAAGPQSHRWDGRTSTGLPAPAGEYTITVTARDAAGQAVPVRTVISGRVDGVDMTGDLPALAIGALRIPLANVKSVGQAAP